MLRTTLISFIELVYTDDDYVNSALKVQLIRLGDRLAEEQLL